MDRTYEAQLEFPGGREQTLLVEAPSSLVALSKVLERVAGDFPLPELVKIFREGEGYEEPFVEVSFFWRQAPSN